MIPTEKLIFFWRGGSTTNQIWLRLVIPLIIQHDVAGKRTHTHQVITTFQAGEFLYHPPVKEHRCGNPTGCRLFSAAYGFSTMFLYVYPSGTSRWDRLHSPVASRLLIYTVSQAEFLHFWHAKETMAMNANYNPITRRNPVGLGLWIP